MKDKQQNESIPESLRGLSPRRDSFWDTVKFYVRLGNECAQRTTDRNILVITVHPSGTFSCVYLLNEDAEALFPALLNGYIPVSFHGEDQTVAALSSDPKKLRRLIREEANSAKVDYDMEDDGVSVSVGVRWNIPTRTRRKEQS